MQAVQSIRSPYDNNTTKLALLEMYNERDTLVHDILCK